MGDSPPDDTAYLEGAYYTSGKIESGTVLRIASIDGPMYGLEVDRCIGAVPCLAGDETLDLIAFDDRGYPSKLARRTTLSALADPILKQHPEQNYGWVEIEQFTPHQTVIIVFVSTNKLLSCEVSLVGVAVSECHRVTSEAQSGSWPVAIRTRAGRSSSPLDAAVGAEISLLFDNVIDGLCFSDGDFSKICPVPGRRIGGAIDYMGYGNFVVAPNPPDQGPPVLRAILGSVSEVPEGMIKSYLIDRLFVINAPVTFQP